MSPQKDVTLCENTSKKIREMRQKTFPGHGGQTRCAKEFGVAVRMWNGWEAGRNIPSEAYQRKLAAFFGITVAELRGELPAGFVQKKAPPYEGEAGEVTKLLSTVVEVQRTLSEVCLEAQAGRVDVRLALHSAEGALDIIRRALHKQAKEGTQRRSG